MRVSGNVMLVVGALGSVALALGVGRRAVSILLWVVFVALFLRNNFTDASLAGASLIVCYLFPRGMERLRPKFERELTPGTLVVSNTFAVPGWRPSRVRRGADLDASAVYVYRAPASGRGMNLVQRA